MAEVEAGSDACLVRSGSGLDGRDSFGLGKTLHYFDMAYLTRLLTLIDNKACYHHIPRKIASSRNVDHKHVPLLYADVTGRQMQM